MINSLFLEFDQYQADAIFAQSEPVRVNISGDDQWFIFRKLIDDAGDAIFNVAVKSKTSLDLSILSTKHSVTPYIFYIKPPSWIEGKNREHWGCIV